jgi:hypothetical protein
MATGELLAWLALATAVLLGVLLVAQTLRLSRIERQFKALMKGAGPGASSLSLDELIAKQGARLETTHNEVEILRKALTALDISVARSVQCVGLVRYNPFQETGGDQSFALALLDTRGNGVVINGLHTRTATRFYAKPVKNGASPMSLSEEETKAVQQAMEGGSKT